MPQLMNWHFRSILGSSWSGESSHYPVGPLTTKYYKKNWYRQLSSGVSWDLEKGRDVVLCRTTE